MYRKLRRVWSRGSIEYIPRFREEFPELRKLSSDELYRRFKALNLDFYAEEVTSVKPWLRFTLPFALILMFLMFLLLPLNFIFTGEWNYKLSDKNIILNWFKSLKLL